MDMSVAFPGLGIEFEYVAKSFRIYGVELSIYGILIAVGMLLGLAVSVLEVKRARENQNQYLMMFIWAVPGALVGARLFYAGFSWKQFQGDAMKFLRINQGGMAFYGALLGGLLTIAIYCSVKKISFMKMADFASIGLVVGQIIGRWGDFFNRESFGEYTDFILHMQLPLASVRAGEVTSLMRENLVTRGGVSYIQVHPLFLYESVWCLLLLLVLLAYKRRKKFQGEIFMRYLAGYGLGRFFIEWLRTDSLLLPGTTLPVSMIISAGLFLIFGTTATVERIMMKKREAIRKRRNEAYYAAEEKMFGEKLSEEEIAEEKPSEEKLPEEETMEEKPSEEKLPEEETVEEKVPEEQISEEEMSEDHLEKEKTENSIE